MPIVIHKDIPAYKSLSEENIFVMDGARGAAQDIRPIEIAILNLMPTKIETETQLLRVLSNTPLQVNVTLVKTSAASKNTCERHLERFYVNFADIKTRKFDGMIITGAPVETLEFEEVRYWSELTAIMEYARKNVTSTMFICWGMQAAMKYFFGAEKRNYPKKLFGVYPHKRAAGAEFEPLLKGCDDVFYIPHSRRTYIAEEDIKKIKNLRVLAHSVEAGSAIMKTADNRLFFLSGHSEYDRENLKYEYDRDREAGLTIDPPENYFDKAGNPTAQWRSTANLIFTNWLNYYVYQITPYNLSSVGSGR